MNDQFLLLLTLAGGVGSGLIGGLFFVFSVAVMPAFGRIAPASAVAAMQSINVTIVNPWFLAAFFGTAASSLALAIAATVGAAGGATGTAVYLVSGALLYLVGAIGVTMAANVLLNNALAAADAGSAGADALWRRYLPHWTRWNHVRTVAALAASGAFFLAAAR